jgi:hypothetical protein
MRTKFKYDTSQLQLKLDTIGLSSQLNSIVLSAEKDIRQYPYIESFSDTGKQDLFDYYCGIHLQYMQWINNKRNK